MIRIIDLIIHLLISSSTFSSFSLERLIIATLRPCLASCKKMTSLVFYFSLTSRAYPLPIPSDAPVTTTYNIHYNIISKFPFFQPAHEPYFFILILDIPQGAKK